MLQDPNVPPSASALAPDSATVSDQVAASVSASVAAAGARRPIAEPAETEAGAATSASPKAPASSVRRSPLRATLHHLAGRRSAETSRTAAAPRPLDPQLAALLAERDRLLGGIPEGVIAVNVNGEVTRLNETARLLLELPATVVGRTLAELGLDSDAIRALGARGADDRDQACVAAGRLLVLNQITVKPRRGGHETVTTLRDRTELVTLRLPNVPGVPPGPGRRSAEAPAPVPLPSPSDQTREFTHRGHTVETLARLGAASIGYLDAICAEQRGSLTRIMDPFVRTLLVARTAAITGRGAELRLTAESVLPRLEPATSADVVTVLGILLDNALDSVEGSPERRLTVHLETVVAGVGAPLAARLVDVRVRVHDTGPGIAGGLIDHIFEIEQITQAPVRHRADPGFGLAIVQLIATRRGGSVGYEYTDGATFDAVLPVRPTAAAPTPTPSVA